ncbi:MULTISPECIES: 3-isopropylmalate dehydratase small subunit [Pseudomonadaceae]|uniref:3-isopropylmalate dehydratase small subunit n=1 Tax=Pseudomonas saudiphocaensis TaxID=1499686 RepID=A0A078LQ99_9PSED|nr:MULTISPECIES: 3-isopropylmalate dehydratase small subunit [Pseudomonadaceae]MBE7927836.1 3-isopropylmalate dehydratase small subunit [Pseudomonas saudiphocaensis]MCF6780746.1 3-isopropylmalate dehydratase small subunit [Stutzerimonas stutzeri]MCF6803316.1 3-isopropylmalate dehydratase small subunit [Stutzerimonas stutzeri]RRV16860.1 3-isopropylmalate dehydratase small subunit [Pseudomonas saudiphocaensis]CDZ93284.1 3-isopropylmalate dehydratase, small subunit [Pseudomonas saudiphocaensis]
MQPLIEHEGVVIPLNRANIDTDMLLPKQYLKSLESFGFGDFLFDDERYLDPGEIDTPIESRRRNPACILNSSPYDQGSVVLAQANFGCGSSREHAVWALRDFGVRVVVAPSFGDIFRNNCFNNGVLPLQLEQAQIDALFAVVESQPGIRAKVSVSERMLWLGDRQIAFELEEGRRQRLLQGLDEIGETLAFAERIKAYENMRKAEEPWLFRE